MKINPFALFAAFALVNPMSAAADSSSNAASIEQIGSGGQASIDQQGTGADNQAAIEQSGSANTADIAQSGLDTTHQAHVDQSGDSNSASITQDGSLVYRHSIGRNASTNNGTVFS